MHWSDQLSNFCQQNLSPKQSFEVLWQLRSSGIARVHCDEDTDSWNHADLLALEVKPGLFVSDGILHTLDLVGWNETLLRISLEGWKANFRFSFLYVG